MSSRISMVGDRFGYEIEEDGLFLSQLTKIGKISHIDEALSILYDLLLKNPKQFEIYAKPNLRIAKTRSYYREGVHVPALRLFFIIKPGKGCEIVNLKYIETIEFDADY